MSDSTITSAELVLGSGCTERQMEALHALYDGVEKDHAILHLSVMGLRSLAHCGRTERLERYADAIAEQSSELLKHIRRERDSIAGLLGKLVEKRLSNT